MAKPARNYAESHPTIRISSKRFRLSPYALAYATDDTVWGVYSGRLYALTWGDDPIEHYWALKRHAALYDVPEHPIAIEGPDAVRLLGRVFCRRIDDLVVGRARYAIACRDDGGILMDGILLRLAADRFWYVLADGDFVPWLHAHARGLDVRITDPESSIIQVQGPRAFDILAAVWDAGQARALKYFHVRECAIAGQRLLVSRTGWTGELGFELYTLDPSPDGPALWRHLLEAGAPFGLVASSLESMGIRRIEAGILDNGTDMDASMTPFQAGLGRFVEFGAGDFAGRAALERADRRACLLGIACHGGVPVAGMTIEHEGRPAGRVTTGAWSPHLGHGVGYARMAAPAAWRDAAVTLVDRAGVRLDATLLDLPFYDPDKLIPRGLAEGGDGA
jgi:aminomethyltransferase